jgi:hypothetical protein
MAETPVWGLFFGERGGEGTGEAAKDKEGDMRAWCICKWPWCIWLLLLTAEGAAPPPSAAAALVKLGMPGNQWEP